MFIDCSKVHITNFSEMGNTVFFIFRKLIKRRYLLDIFELSTLSQDLRMGGFGAVEHALTPATTTRNMYQQHVPTNSFLWLYFPITLDEDGIFLI